MGSCIEERVAAAMASEGVQRELAQRLERERTQLEQQVRMRARVRVCVSVCACDRCVNHGPSSLKNNPHLGPHI